MKCTTILFLMVLLSWSGLSFGAVTTIPADVTGQIEVIKSGLVYNRSTKTFNTTLTLTNTSQASVYGAITVSVIVSDPTNIGLANSVGLASNGVYPTVKVLPPNGVLSPGGTIKNVVLAFSNPKQETFTYNLGLKAAIDQSAQSSATITDVSPNGAPTGTIITINGTGFTNSSKVSFGTNVLPNPNIISATQISIIVPFDTNQQGQLIPLANGVYPIKVNNSISYNFTVTELPANPNAPGVVINQVINGLQQSISNLTPYFQDAISELSSINLKLPQQQLLADLNNLFSYQTALIQYIKNNITYVDPISLDTLERVMLINNLDTQFKALASNLFKSNYKYQEELFSKILNSMFTAVLGKNADADTLPSGDNWLTTRAAIFSANEPVKRLDAINDIATWISLIPGDGTAAGIALRAVTAVTGLVTGIYQNGVSLILAQQGTIKTFNIGANGTASVNSSNYLQYNFSISNINSSTASYTNPSITVTHQFKIDAVNDLILSLKILAANNPVINKALELLGTLVKNDGNTILNVAKDQPYSIGFNNINFNYNCVPIDQNTGTLDFSDLVVIGNYLNLNSTSNAYNFNSVLQEPTHIYPQILCSVGILAPPLLEPEDTSAGYLPVMSVYQITPYTIVNVYKNDMGGDGSIASVATDYSGSHVNALNGDIGCPDGSGSIQCSQAIYPSTWNSAYPKESMNNIIITAHADNASKFTGWSGNDVSKCTISTLAQPNDMCTLYADGTSINLTAQFGGLINVAGNWDVTEVDKESCDVGNDTTVNTYNYSISITQNGNVLTGIGGSRTETVVLNGYTVITDTPPHPDQGGITSKTGSITFNKDGTSFTGFATNIWTDGVVTCTTLVTTTGTKI